MRDFLSNELLLMHQFFLYEGYLVEARQSLLWLHQSNGDKSGFTKETGISSSDNPDGVSAANNQCPHSQKVGTGETSHT